jgi:hypothetical protein
MLQRIHQTGMRVSVPDSASRSRAYSDEALFLFPLAIGWKRTCDIEP